MSLLEPLPETLEAWEAAGHPDVYSEVRPGLGCDIVGTLEIAWPGPGSPTPMIRVRAVVPLGEDIDSVVQRAESVRSRSIRPCACCGERTTPERTLRLHGQRICHGCATTDYGVVF